MRQEKSDLTKQNTGLIDRMSEFKKNMPHLESSKVQPKERQPEHLPKMNNTTKADTQKFHPTNSLLLQVTPER